MLIHDRYATAIRSSNLKIKELKVDETAIGDAEVVSAMAFADKELTTGMDSLGNPVRPAPLAVALERLFLGDNAAAVVIVERLAEMAWERAKARRIKLKRAEAADMARACLAWHRDGACKPCGGHGYLVIRGSTTIGNQSCKACKGTGRLPFDKNFAEDLREIANWLLDEMSREQSRAGPAAMRKLAPSLDL